MKTTILILPSNPLDPRVVDPAFQQELNTLRWDDNFTWVLVDHDLLQNTEEVRFSHTQNLDKLTEQIGIYRGWMLTPHQYEVLFDALKSKLSIVLESTPTQYVTSHYITGWVQKMTGLTPATRTLPIEATVDEIINAGLSLNSTSFIVKDYVKSRKHEWETACFAANVEQLPSVVSEMVRLQDDFLNGGIAIREFVPLAENIEVRYWWVNGKFVEATVHPDYEGEPLTVPQELLDTVSRRLNELDVNFVTADFAISEKNEWILIEIGDGQVSGFNSSISESQIHKIISRD